MIIHTSSRRGSSGFSLIEILIAVVVLATGLLALTALQGSLAKASGEAKVRGRVAAFMAGRMEFLRNGPYDGIVAATGSCTSTSGTGFVPSTVCADAGIGSLNATQAVETWAGETTFTTTNTPITDPDAAQFKRVTLTVTWTDATGSGRTLRSISDISPLGLVTNLIVPPDAEGSGGGAPVVRQDNPVKAGMIPVALGDGSSSAASNPKPELKEDGRNQRIVATRFNVLNYIPENGGSARIQKRFENELVRCNCARGSGETDTASIYYNAQWPAIWTGDRYDVYTPDPATAAPGQTLRSGPISGSVQSDLCTQCCRDHHDAQGATAGKFDPERTLATGETSGVEKYSRDGSGVYTISTTDYIQACRVIRVDGFWRVAADTYSRHFGLLPTSADNLGVEAKSGNIPTSISDAYGTFVKDYAAQYSGTIASAGTPPTSPIDADTMFDQLARGLNAETIDVLVPNVNNDWRYLHARGLYIDYLEADARKRIQDVLADTGTTGACPSGTPVYDCILPYLPFTTINMTELAKWLAGDEDILQVNSGNIMSSNPSEPFGGRTKGIAAGEDSNTASALRSNSGLAVYAVAEDTDNDGVVDTVNRQEFGTDPQDDTQIGDDAQAFNVGGITSNPGQSFYLSMTGAGINRSATYSLGITDQDDCSTPAVGNIRCQTNQLAGAMSGSFTIRNYWIEGTGTSTLSTAGCTNLTNQTPPATLSVTNVPVFTNLGVSGVTVSSGSATVTTAMPAAADSGDGTTSEATTISFSNAAADTVFLITLSTESQVNTATVASCTVDRVRGDWVMTVTAWNRPWNP